MQDTLQYQVLFIQKEYFYLHYNVSENHELLFLFVPLKTDYILYTFSEMLYYLIEIVFEKTNYFHQYYDKRSNGPIILFGL